MAGGATAQEGVASGCPSVLPTTTAGSGSGCGAAQASAHAAAQPPPTPVASPPPPALPVDALVLVVEVLDGGGGFAGLEQAAMTAHAATAALRLTSRRDMCTRPSTC